jgi:secreted trypsin-like serine protease
MMRSLAALLLSALPFTSATAMVGGANPASDEIGRSVVLIIGSRGNFCTGVLLARDLVLTVAHCVLPGAAYKVVEFDAARQPKPHDAASVTLHPGFDMKALMAQRATADVALVKLAAPLAGRFAPTRLGATENRVAVGDAFTVAGYGVAVHGDGKSGGTVRAARLVATGKPGNLQVRLVDAATKGSWPGLGACTGDSGAPVFDVTRGVVGVVSWSTGPNASAGCGGFTGVTPLTLYRGWIVETARKLGSPVGP